MAPRKTGPSAGERMLNEAYDAAHEFLSVTDAQAAAMTLYAAATHVMRSFPAFGRMLFTADGPESGKTAAMMFTAYLSSNAENAAGSSYALTSLMAQATNQPETPPMTLFRDEISEVFGKSGLNSSKDPIAPVLRDGYKRGATTAWSVNRVHTKISVYLPVLMAGNGTAVPMDIRSRSIVVKMRRGRPVMDLDSDGSEDFLRSLGKALGATVGKDEYRKAMKGYTCEGMLPSLIGRKHQVWRPLFAVAQIVGGETWLNRAVDAYNELTASGGSNEVLSPNQQALKDMCAVVADMELKPTEFVGGKRLAEEMATMPRYQNESDDGLCKMIARAMGHNGTQRRVVKGGNPVRGYWVNEVTEAWDMARPARVDEIQARESTNPFDV